MSGSSSTSRILITSSPHFGVMRLGKMSTHGVNGGEQCQFRSRLWTTITLHRAELPRLYAIVMIPHRSRRPTPGTLDDKMLTVAIVAELTTELYQAEQTGPAPVADHRDT